MSAQIIPLRSPESVETLASPPSPLQARLRASMTGAGRLWWHRARRTVEALGWIVVAASIIAAIPG